MDRLEIVAPRLSGEVEFAAVLEKRWLWGIGIAKMVTTGRSSMHLKKASLLSRQWGPLQYYKWSKAFLEAGKRQLNGDTIREAGSDEVKELRTENDDLKMLVAELTLRNRTLKKTSQGLESGSIDT